jgi:hypothetical protein
MGMLSTFTFGYSGFALFALAMWAMVGSYFRMVEGPMWTWFHKLTFVLAPLLSIISIILMSIDYSE